MKNREQICFFLVKITDICLVFLIAVIPLIINPFAMDYWYKPKIEAVYALLLIIILITVFKTVVLKTTFPLIKSPLLLPLCFYGLSAVVSTIFSVCPEMSFCGDMWREESLFAILSYCALPVVFATYCRSYEHGFYLIKALLVSSFIVALYGIVQLCGYNPTEYFIEEFRTERITSTIGNANFLGLFLVLILPLFIAVYLTAENLFKKIFYAAGVLVSTATLILTFTRASWLGFIIGCLVLVCLVIKQTKDFKIIKNILICLVFILLCASVLFFYKGWEISATVEKRVESALDLEKGMGSATRLFIWSKTLGVIAEKPIIGYGPDTHIIVLDSISSEYAKKFRDYGRLDGAHNQYLDIAIGQGLLGLTAYLAVITVFMILLLRALGREKELQKKILLCGIFASFCGYIVNGFFSFNVVSVSPTFWALIGIGLAMMRSNDKFVGTRMNMDLTD